MHSGKDIRGKGQAKMQYLEESAQAHGARTQRQGQSRRAKGALEKWHTGKRTGTKVREGTGTRAQRGEYRGKCTGA